MRFARVVSCVVCLAFAGATLTGCNLFGPPKDKNAPLIPAANAPIADVPLPAGFTMVTSDSTSKVIPGNKIRFVDHHYKGEDDVLPVVKFYREQMPERGWNLVDQNQAKGNEVSLHYTKNSEDCYVTINPSGFGFTYIRIRIDPMGRDAAK